MPINPLFVEAIQSAWREHTGAVVTAEEAAAMASRLATFVDLLLRAPVERCDLTECGEERDAPKHKT